MYRRVNSRSYAPIERGVAVASRSSASGADPGGDAVGMEAAMVSGSGRCAKVESTRHGRRGDRP